METPQSSQQSEKGIDRNMPAVSVTRRDVGPDQAGQYASVVLTPDEEPQRVLFRSPSSIWVLIGSTHYAVIDDGVSLEVAVYHSMEFGAPDA